MQEERNTQMQPNRKRTIKHISLLILITLGIIGTGKTSQNTPITHADNGQRCFDETGYCIEGAIRYYWEQNGGLPVFGYPITQMREETIEGTWTGPVQWFERDRLEDHGIDGVMAGRLGVKTLELRGTDWRTLPAVYEAPEENCHYFSQTAHSLCEPFKSYWEQNGGLERFGYPISEPRTETYGDWTGTVQWFERRRMEHHTEYAGTQYEILLGLLGKSVLNQQGTCEPVMEELKEVFKEVHFANQMGCPQEIHHDLPASIQNMENGAMLWVDYGGDEQKIYALWTWGRYEDFNDSWDESMPERPNVNPPDGKYAPIRGFGKVWQDNPNIRNGLGWAIEERERPEVATVQVFDDGRLVWLKQADVVWALGPHDQAQLVTR